MKSINTIGSRTYQRIKKDIIYGKLEPSTKLKLDILKDQYETSRPTLRETLNRLASEGFVLAEEQRGFFVKPVSKNDFKEITNLRVLLESNALKLSVQNGDTDWEGNLVAAHHKLHTIEKRRLGNDKPQRELNAIFDFEFHLALIGACENKNLLDLHAIIFDKYIRYQMLDITYRGIQAIEEHKAIFESSLDRDFNKATKLLKNHIENGLEHVLQNSINHPMVT